MAEAKEQNIATNYTGELRDPTDLRRTPPTVVEQMEELFNNPEYVHGTGCKCAENFYKKDICPVGDPIYRKIGAKLGIGHHTVHATYDPKYREHYREVQRKYNRSKKGKETKKAHNLSDKGRAAKRRSYRRAKQKDN